MLFVYKTRLRRVGGAPNGILLSLGFEATFAQLSTEAGLGELWIQALKANSLATFAKLSFAVTSPGVVVTDDQINTKMSASERETRLELQKQTFRGLDISGPLEPAHSFTICAPAWRRRTRWPT